MSRVVRLIVPAGKAKPSPAIGQTMGGLGLNMMMVSCSCVCVCVLCVSVRGECVSSYVCAMRVGGLCTTYM